MSSYKFKLRKRYELRIIELTKQADKYSREFIETENIDALRKYSYYCNEIMKLKEFIIENESKEDDE
ncbi:hypothetical protein N9I00_01430 [bacterium]|nr:hypothetical protein [bacterium]